MLIITVTQSATFKQTSAGGEGAEYDYTRSGNPTRDALADAIASLEGAEGAVIAASGMAAITLVTQLLGPQDLLVAPHDCYGGTYRLFAALAKRQVLQVEFVDQTDGSALDAALDRSRASCYLEGRDRAETSISCPAKQGRETPCGEETLRVR